MSLGAVRQLWRLFVTMRMVNMKRQRSRRSSWRRNAPSSEQIRFILSALGLKPRVLAYVLGLPTFVVDCWTTGRILPDPKSSEVLWHMWNMPYVQKSLPGFLYIKVIPPKVQGG